MKFTIFALLIASSSAWATPPPRPAWEPETWNLELDGSYFSTQNNYTDTGGEYDRLAQNGAFSTYQGTAQLRYSLLPSLSLFAGGAFGYSHAEKTGFTDSKYNFNGVKVGLDHIFLRWWLRGLLHIEGFVTSQTTTATSQHVLTQDGVHYLHPSVFVYKKLKQLMIFANFGVKVPTEGMAKLITWGAGAEFSWQKLLLGGGIYGQEILQKDEYTDTPLVRQNLSNAINAGSYTFYAVNPTSMVIDIYTQFRLAHQAQLRLGVYKTINGSNNAEGLGITAGYVYSFGAKPKSAYVSPKRRRESLMAPVKQTPSEDGFETYLEDEPTLQQNEVTPQYGPDGEPIKDTERILENRLKKK